jgi:hypothetical protein
MKFAAFALIAGITLGNAVAADAPKVPCDRPTIPNKQASDMVMKSFNKHMTVYKKCISDFVADRRAVVDHATDQAVATEAHDAAEAAINEYNEQIKQLNERNGGEPEEGDAK